MPCTAKRMEAGRSEFTHGGQPDVDLVLTTQELIRMIKEAGIRFNELPDGAPDMPFGLGTGAGVIFGTTGGVGGAGQSIGRKEQKYARAKGLYEADRKTLIKSSQHNPILKTLYEKLPPEKAHELLHVHYPQPE